MDSGQYQFCALRVVQVDVRLHAAERTRGIVDHVINELVQVKNRADLLRRLLQLQEIFDLSKIEGLTDVVRDSRAWSSRHEWVSKGSPALSTKGCLSIPLRLCFLL